MRCSLETVLAIVAGIFALLPSSLCGSWKSRQRLMNEVFRGYNRLVPPQANTSEPIQVSVDLRVLKLLKLDQIGRSLSIIGWIQLTWTDARLKWDEWDEEKYQEQKEIDHLVVPQRKIWTPDIILRHADEPMKPLGEVSARLRSDGTIRLVLPNLMTTPCDAEPGRREEICYIKVGTWANDVSIVNIQPASDRVNALEAERNPRWELAKTKARAKTKTYGEPPHNMFSYAEFEIGLNKRKGVDEPKEPENAASCFGISLVLLLVTSLLACLRTVA